MTPPRRRLPLGPAIAVAPFLTAGCESTAGTADVVVHGLDGPLTVNGQPFDGIMPALLLTDEDVANVLTFVYSRWENAGFVVLPEEVEAIRRQR